ncbi:hypothetical protein [Serratia marcescens]|uniref:hypothetical protein n=1 Tax=Serratia marcescens TaxID=615 RepID=UPI003CFC9AB1
MTRTLTTEQLNDYARVFRKDAERWVEKGEPEIAQELHALADEIDALAANREAQPVALVDRRPAASGGICWQHGGKDLPHGTELFTLPPAIAKAVAWEMRYWNSGHNMWHDWERITAEQHAEMSVQHATDNDYEFRILYDAPPAPAVPDAIPEVDRGEGGSDIDYMQPQEIYDMGKTDGWNACLAAMLKGERP